MNAIDERLAALEPVAWQTGRARGADWDLIAQCHGAGCVAVVVFNVAVSDVGVAVRRAESYAITTDAGWQWLPSAHAARLARAVLAKMGMTEVQE